MFDILTKCVFSSKDMGKNSQHVEYKRRNSRDPVKKEDVTQHLVAAFIEFLRRQDYKEESTDVKKMIDKVRAGLTAAYCLPGDDSLKVPRNIDDIFFRDVGNLITIDNKQE